ncbi:hypothetical protein AZE42_08542 [Rhizopogon vesiculosus]|uniref:Exocyst component Exo84 C-terminal domain-containing protein n=1 Tax=Rhizopogon vesiculosus TaxID=180088 RepID=A0A1J8QC96_9AGAM|nr:hypothetical protein AZE42_08542 [Rhizopogon vesiculosus]
MNRYVRAIRFESYVGMYVHDLAVVVFTGIKHTADWFLGGFVEHEMTSSFIDWAKQQINVYAKMFRKQVYSSDAQQGAVEEALKITHNQSRKLLQEFGLDFRFLLDELLVQNSHINDASLVSATFRAPSRGHSISRSQTPQPHLSLSIPSTPNSPARCRTKISSIPSLTTRLTPLTASLTSALLDALSAPGNRKNIAVGLICYLLRLGQGPAARSTFLNARAEAMNRYVRAIRFESYVGMYVHDLAVVVFTGIKHTADWFLGGFVEHEMTSSFIDWAKKQINMYAEMFRKQVYSSDAQQETVEEALKITHNQSRKVCSHINLASRS